MQTPTTPNLPQQSLFKRAGLNRPGAFGRWYLPVMLTMAVGFGISNVYTSNRPNYYDQVQEEERLHKNQQIMDSYGMKDSVDDLERALEAYDIQ
ncbi:hypothetical protein ARAM_006357 [Aspergillus rambellii]|uniref:Cytochrome c oxidase assembly protein n=1 Tax=Aspergillus rambellii TaxID=308745 RepID=A0A0F8UDB1_9EURO|nr:hypothetical protein ARAM_006357 [Aspergillus rambellii]